MGIRETYRADDPIFFITLAKFGGRVVCAGLAHTVLVYSMMIPLVVKVVKRDAPLWGVLLGRGAGYPDDADRILGADLGRRLKKRRELLRKEKGTKTVDPKLQLIALSGLRALRWVHDSSIVEEYIEP